MAFAKNHDRLQDALFWIATDMFLVGQIMDTQYLNSDGFSQDYGGTSLDLPTRWWGARLAWFGGGAVVGLFAARENNAWGEKASWDELAPGSAFHQALAANHSAEQITHSYSILSDQGYGNDYETAGYLGGPFRLMTESPAQADDIAIRLYHYGVELDDLGMALLTNFWDNPHMWRDFGGAIGAFDLAYRLKNLGAWWTWDIVEGWPHDGLVVTANQARPGSTTYRLLHTSHVQETRSLNSQFMIKNLLDLDRE